MSVFSAQGEVAGAGWSADAGGAVRLREASHTSAHAFACGGETHPPSIPSIRRPVALRPAALRPAALRRARAA
ncbi:hypothetical protein EFP18_08370 [Burkholderia glumae]|nr:hypothetical protein DF052_16575 [Burkholderia glumae]UVS84170.1 hypothetical protein EFP18_08370 [Burkholderia glumae]